MPYEKDPSGEFGYDPPAANDGADEREWDDLKVRRPSSSINQSHTSR
jgi:hypothetical protein